MFKGTRLTELSTAGVTQDVPLPSGWLDPLPEAGAPGGPNLEYENEFLELIRGAEGKPASQFAPGEPPNWPFVRERAESLMARTRDLRVAVFWTRANVNLSGFAALASGLRLIDGLLTNLWDAVHPLPDPEDGDQFARSNALAVLSHPEGLCADVRQCALFGLRGSGVIRFRDVAVAYGQSVARPDEVSYSKEQLAQMAASAVSQAPDLPNQWRSVIDQAKALAATVTQKFDAEIAPDLKPLVEMIKLVHGLLPAPAPGAAADTPEGSAEGAPRAAAPAALGEVMSREDVLRALDRVCEYLDRVEPSNPAQLLLRRARRMINRNFLELLKELAPDAVNEAARVLGVDPDTVNVQTGA